MTNTDFSQFRKILFSSVISVLLTAGGTALAFYYSTTNTLANISSRLEGNEAAIRAKVDLREYENFVRACERRDEQSTRRFEIIDQKLDYLIRNQNAPR
jgi:hypothetical protein